MAKKEIYYVEQRFGNDLNGNPKKSVSTYVKDEKSNYMHLDKVKTYQYGDGDREVKKLYNDEKNENVYIKIGEVPDTFKRAKEVEKYNKKESK